MENYVVVKKIKDGRNTVAKIGTKLVSQQNFSRIGGVAELRKSNGTYVCDVGSRTEQEYCKKI